MNDEIDKLNKQNEDLNKPSQGNFSQAVNSNITTPEEDNKKSMAENIILDLGNQRQDIDFLKETIKKIFDQQQGLANQINQITQALNQSVQGTPQNPTSGTPQGLNMETINALGDLAQKGVEVYKSLKGNPATTNSFIDQDYINDQVKKSVMGNFEIGEALVNNLKSKLVNKAVASSVSDAMKESSHDPQ